MVAAMLVEVKMYGSQNGSFGFGNGSGNIKEWCSRMRPGLGFKQEVGIGAGRLRSTPLFVILRARR
jgi:hypothetical protein